MKLVVLLAFILILIAELAPIAIRYADQLMPPLKRECFGLSEMSSTCCKNGKMG